MDSHGMLWYIKFMDKPNNKGCQHPLSNPNMILESHDKIFEVTKRICSTNQAVLCGKSVLTYFDAHVLITYFLTLLCLYWIDLKTGE